MPLYSRIIRTSRGGQKLLDVAVGTGFPFGDFFTKHGYTVYGIDIAPNLINKCKSLYPSINCMVGDVEDMNYPDNFFNLAYCFHSTWYFPNLTKAIDEMLRVTVPGGFVIFDIQNRNNDKINSGYLKRLPDPIVLRLGKNIIKLIVRRDNLVWNPIVHEVPTYPETIYKYISQKGVKEYDIMVKKEDESLEKKFERKSFEEFPRMIFSVTVPKK